MVETSLTARRFWLRNPLTETGTLTSHERWVSDNEQRHHPSLSAGWVSLVMLTDLLLLWAWGGT